MSNCVDERVMLFVAADFANEESGVEDQSKDQKKREYDAENKQRPSRRLRMIQPTFRAIKINASLMKKATDFRRRAPYPPCARF